MSYYTTRKVAFGEGESLSATACTLNFNYLRTAELSVEETQSLEFILAGGRDKRRVAVLQEEPDIRLEADLMGFKALYYALGSITTDTVSPYITIGPNSVVPYLTIVRELTPTVSGENKCLKIYGAKVDSAEITIERGEVGGIELSLIGKRATLTTEDVSVSVDYDLDPIYYSDVDVVLNTSTLPEVGRIVITIDNNLARRYSASTAAGYGAYHILEGGLEVSGRLLVGEKALSMLSNVLSRSGNNTLEVKLNKTHGGVVTGTITMPNVWFTSYPERMRGIEPYEVEIPFVALPTETQNAITVTCNTIYL